MTVEPQHFRSTLQRTRRGSPGHRGGMPWEKRPRSLRKEILKALLYYDIWHYPLTAGELFAYLPTNSITMEEFATRLQGHVGEGIASSDGYYYIDGNSPAIVANRRQRERHARGMWTRARLAAGLIKRFPFVRALFVSGELAMNSTSSVSDVDFVVVTEPGRLWISRALLILFKKVFLLNSKKYFCLNCFVAAGQFAVAERNAYVAAEVAHLKPIYRASVLDDYLRANRWILEFFPNFRSAPSLPVRTIEGRSLLQKALELPFALVPADRLDTFLLNTMRRVWVRRYASLDHATRERLFRCTKSESRAYAGNFEDMVLSLYARKLAEFGVSA